MKQTTYRFLTSQLIVPLFLLTLFVTTVQGQEKKKIDFADDIKPILSSNCFQCHGPDMKNRKAKLRLDQQESAHDSAIVAGKSKDSELFKRISSNDPKALMPPPKSGKKKLTAVEIKKIKDWIDQGASYHSATEIQSVIAGMIKGGRSVRDNVLRDSKGVLKDMKVFQDEMNSGIVFRYTYAEGVTVDKSRLTPVEIKKLMLPQLRGDKNVQYALSLGIYVKIVYESSEGEVYGKAKISEADFRKNDDKEDF